MSTTHFWVYDVERAYIKLIDQSADRADKTHYLYKHHINITRAATGQQRLTKFTYRQVWLAINAGKFEPAEIRQFVLEAKKKLAQETGGQAFLSVAKRRRDINRAINHQQHLAKKEKEQNIVAPPVVQALMPAFTAVKFVPESHPADSAVQRDSAPPSDTVSVASLSSDDTPGSGLISRPIAPSGVYKDLEDAMIFARLEQPETLKIAQMKMCKHILRGGENICYPMTDFAMDVHLSSSGIPCDPDFLYNKLEELAHRRGIVFSSESIYKDLKRAYGYVMFIAGKSSPECYKYIRY